MLCTADAEPPGLASCMLNGVLRPGLRTVANGEGESGGRGSEGEGEREREGGGREREGEGERGGERERGGREGERGGRGSARCRISLHLSEALLRNHKIMQWSFIQPEPSLKAKYNQ